NVHNTAHADITGTQIPLASVVHDTATTGGQVDSIPVNGTITFTFFTTATNCTGGSSSPAASAGTGADAGKTVSAATGALVGGNYSYIATIASDANYNSATAACEPFVVLPVMPLRKFATDGTTNTDGLFTFGLFIGPSTTVAGITTPS